jgi:hypothetical protein
VKRKKKPEVQKTRRLKAMNAEDIKAAAALAKEIAEANPQDVYRDVWNAVFYVALHPPQSPAAAPET